LFDVILLYILLASVFPLSRVGVTTAQPIFFTGVRMAIAGIFLISYFYIRHSKQFKKYVTLKYLKHWILFAVFNIYLTNVLEFWGLQTLSAAKACFIYNLAPFFVALFSYIIFREKMTFRKCLGLAIGFASFIPILIHHSSSEKLISGIPFLSLAELALLGAAVATAFGWTIMRYVTHTLSYPPILSNGMSMLLGLMLIFPTSLLFEQWNPVPVYHCKQFAIYVVVIAIVSNILGYNLYAYLLKKYTATFLSLAGFMSPLFAAVMGWFFLGETVTWHFFASSVGVFAGLFIFYREEIRLGYIGKS